MNNTRRKELNRIIDDLQEIQARIESLSNEEQDSFDNLPESLQEGERGQTMQECAELLFEAADGIADICEQLSDVVTK